MGSTTIRLHRLSKTERLRLRVLEPSIDHPRPQTRAECLGSDRPCPYVGCRHHLFLDVQQSGNLVLRFPDLEPHELRETCALDIADQGPQKLETIAELLNCTRERIRQIEARALWKISRTASGALLRDFLGLDGEYEPRTLSEFRTVGRRHCRRCGEAGHNVTSCDKPAPEEGSDE